MSTATAQQCEVLAELLVTGVPAVACSAGLYATRVPMPQVAATGVAVAVPMCHAQQYLYRQPALQAVLTRAVSGGCEVAVHMGSDTWQIIVYRFNETSAKAKAAVESARRTVNWLNTPQGVAWLMWYLSSR